MQGVVLAAGEGTRMRPLTSRRPKGLVEVAGRPLLSYAFETLGSFDVTELIVVVGYRGNQIKAHYGDWFSGTPITYARQDDPRGLAHALCAAEPYVDGDVLVIHGDNIYDADLSPVVARHRDTNPIATVLVDEVPREQAREVGVFELDDAGEPVGLVEKPADPPSTLVLRGFYVLAADVLAACHRIEPSDRGEYELTAVIDHLLASGAQIELVRFDGWCRNVNTPADRDIADRYLRESGGGR